MCAKNIQDPLNILQVNCGQGWRAAALRGRWTVCTFVTGRAGAGAGPLWFPAQGTASSCFSTLSPLDPAPLCTIGPPVLLVLTESTLHTIVDSTVGGVVEGQSGDWGSEAAVEALREPGAQGADLWVPRPPHEGGALLGALAGHCPPEPGPGSRPCLCPFLHTGCSEGLCCWLHPELRVSSEELPPGETDTQQGGGHGS